MSNILDRYGIKEVADVVFYTINSDGTPGTPVLILDTLKVSTIEQTAESTSARGGKGNPELISWDYGKEITVTLEDALFSAKSMALMYGVDVDVNNAFGEEEYILKTVKPKNVEVDEASSSAWFIINGEKVAVNSWECFSDKGELLASDSSIPEGTVYVTGHIKVNGQKISISADSFPGTYYLVGDTYARSAKTGQDEFFQFIIPKAKMQSEVTLTMEAEGDPSTFNMSMKVLRPANGQMMKLVKCQIMDIIASGSFTGTNSPINWQYDTEGNLYVNSKAATNMSNTVIPTWQANTTVKNNCKQVYVQDFIKFVGTKAFYASKVEAIHFGDSIRKIGSQVFQSCNNLNTITFGRSAKAPYLDNFRFVPNLINMSVASGNPYLYNDSCGGLVDLADKTDKGYESHFDSRTLVAVPRNLEQYVVPEGIQQINRYAFSDCNKLKYIDASAYEEGALLGLPDVEYIRWKGDA